MRTIDAAPLSDGDVLPILQLNDFKSQPGRSASAHRRHERRRSTADRSRVPGDSVTAVLGDNAGMIGAGLLALREPSAAGSDTVTSPYCKETAP